MPTTISTPISAITEKPCPAASSASTMPISVHGTVNSMMSGSRSERNWLAMIMKTTMTASPIATPRPPKVSRMSWT